MQTLQQPQQTTVTALQAVRVLRKVARTRNNSVDRRVALQRINSYSTETLHRLCVALTQAKPDDWRLPSRLEHIHTQRYTQEELRRHLIYYLLDGCGFTHTEFRVALSVNSKPLEDRVLMALQQQPGGLYYRNFYALITNCHNPSPNRHYGIGRQLSECLEGMVARGVLDVLRKGGKCFYTLRKDSDGVAN